MGGHVHGEGTRQQRAESNHHMRERQNECCLCIRVCAFSLSGELRSTSQQFPHWKHIRKRAVMKGYFRKVFSVSNYRSETLELGKKKFFLFTELLCCTLFLKQSWYIILGSSGPLDTGKIIFVRSQKSEVNQTVAEKAIEKIQNTCISHFILLWKVHH